MTFKAIASALAVSSTLLLSGGAYAQTMINGMSISADDLPKVQERCDQLSTAADTQSLTQDTDSKAGDAPDAADATLSDPPQANEVANATSVIDLDGITIEACTAAGLTK